MATLATTTMTTMVVAQNDNDNDNDDSQCRHSMQGTQAQNQQLQTQPRLLTYDEDGNENGHRHVGDDDDDDRIGGGDHVPRFGANDRGMAPMEAAMVCVSVVNDGSEIAFACYDEEKNHIVIEGSHANGYDAEDIVERFYACTRPTLVLIGNKIAANEDLLHLLTRPLDSEGFGNDGMDNTVYGTDDAAASDRGLPLQNRTGNTEDADHSPMAMEQHHCIPYRLLKSGAFDHRKCRSLIVQKLRVLDLLRKQPQNPDHRERHPEHIGQHYREPLAYHALSAVIDFDSKLQVQAVGSLVSFLQSTLYRLEEGGTVTVNTILHAKTSMYMKIDDNSLRALHIFATEHHPLMSKGHGHTKEGFSLFSLFDRTKSRMGRACLREWMQKPLVDHDQIQQRHDGIELFLQARFQASTGKLLQLLQSVGAVDKLLLRLQKCHTSPMDLVVLSRTLFAAIEICETLQHELLHELATQLEQAQAQEQEQEVSPHGIEEVAQTDGDQTMLLETETGFAARAFAFLQELLQECNTAVLKDLFERITATIDEEATADSRTSVVIRRGFHEELDIGRAALETLDGERICPVCFDYRARTANPAHLSWQRPTTETMMTTLTNFRSCSETLSETAGAIIDRHTELTELNVLYMPQVRPYDMNRSIVCVVSLFVCPNGCLSIVPLAFIR